MVAPDVIERVNEYIEAVEKRGITVSSVIVYGSHARGEAKEWSDIDVVVVSPVFDNRDSGNEVNILWEETAGSCRQIEPVPCGKQRWTEEDGSPIIEIARTEGVQIFP